MESWPEHVARHSYDAFWVGNEPVFHAYDYGANIEIEVSEGLQTLGRETRLRLREGSDDKADANSGHNEGSAAGGNEATVSTYEMPLRVYAPDIHFDQLLYRFALITNGREMILICTSDLSRTRTINPVDFQCVHRPD
ncbi:hypothetical protein V500_05450 [Pseudogymnoascus sp. VKM F-4518 (FW-2643)]|nr:hypothetical protein V500_05450 [Pseudogymnoascus sp. VKM F-4518 (FW-2643)]